jgi:DNA-binding response OmpR family regulator
LTQAKEKIILLIEDDLGDQKLIKRSIMKFNPNIKILVLPDGEEVIEYFKVQKKNNPNTAIPDLILLDLNLPKINGLRVLKYIKSSENIKKIPVVILTTSNAETDVNNCYENFACGYFRKPTTINEFELKINSILSYWFESCILPTKGQAGMFQTTMVE